MSSGCPAAPEPFPGPAPAGSSSLFFSFSCSLYHGDRGGFVGHLLLSLSLAGSTEATAQETRMRETTGGVPGIATIPWSPVPAVSRAAVSVIHATARIPASPLNPPSLRAKGRQPGGQPRLLLPRPVSRRPRGIPKGPCHSPGARQYHGDAARETRMQETTGWMRGPTTAPLVSRSRGLPCRGLCVTLGREDTGKSSGYPESPCSRGRQGMPTHGKSR